MSKINFEDGISVEATHLNAAETALEKQIKDTFLDTHTYGVILSKSPDIIVWTDGDTLGSYGVTAYDYLGNHIYIPTSGQDSNGRQIPTIQGLLPDETGKLIHGGNALTPQTSYTLVIRYKTVNGEPIAHKATDGTPVLMGVTDSYELYLRPYNESIAGDVVLADVVTDISGVISINEDSRVISRVEKGSVAADISSIKNNCATSDYGTNITFEDHINSIGTGQVSEQNPHGLSAQDLGIDIGATVDHQKLLHVTGLRSDNVNSTVSAMYPYYLTETASSRDVVVIRALSTELNEEVVINGKSIFPISFPTDYQYSFENLATENNKGYYLFYFDSVSETVLKSGPFPSEEDVTFVTLLNTPSYFPICSFKWDEVEYDLTGDGVADSTSYDIIPATFKDRRIFNNTSLQNFRPDDAFAISQFAPVAKDVAHIHNVKLVGTNKSPAYNLSGQKLELEIDGVSVNTTFTGANPLPVNEIISQLLTRLTAYYSSGEPYLRAYPRIITEKSGKTEDVGKLSISAPSSIKIGDTTAARLLGFTIENDNTEAVSSGLVQEMLYYGERNGIIIFTYDDNDLITQIDYFLGGGKVRRNIFHYSNEYITRVEELIEAL